MSAFRSARSVKFTGIARCERPVLAFNGKVAVSFDWSWTDQYFHSIENLNERTSQEPLDSRWSSVLSDAG